MEMEFEIFPIVSGIVVGCILGYLRPGLRWKVGLALVVALGVLATVGSGEFRLSWGFLLIDIPLVAVSAAAALYVVHRWRWSNAPRA